MVIGSVLYCQYIVLVLPKRYHTCYPSVVDGTGVSYIGSVVSNMANIGILLPKPSFTLDAISCILLLVARPCLNFEVTNGVNCFTWFFLYLAFILLVCLYRVHIAENVF